MKKTKQGASVVKGNIHNPAKKAKWSLGLPGERNTMATANKAKPKRRNKSKGGRRNTAAPKSTHKPKANTSKRAATKRASTPKANTRRKKRYQRSRRNGFSFKGLNAVDLGVGAIALITTQALAQALRRWVDPSSYLGLGLQLGLAAAGYAIAPANIRNAVVLGAGITPVANGINRLTGNVIGNTIENTVLGFLPAAPAPQQQGMGALVNYDQNSPLFRGNYQYAQ